MAPRPARNKRRPLGWLPDKTDPRDFNFELLGGPSSLPEAVSLRAGVPGVYSQGSTSSCVANAYAGALRIVEQRAGLAPLGVSRLFLYHNSRRFHGAHRRDAGTYIRTAAKALTRFGAPDETFWGFSTNPIKINRAPNWTAFMRAHPRRGGCYYRINAIGDERVRQICKAIADGLPVVFGTQVDQAFTRNDGDYVIRLPDTSAMIGGHAMAIIGYSYTPGQGFLFEVLNSWGDDWRAGGFCWFTEEYITSALARDFTVILGWERLQRQQ